MNCKKYNKMFTITALLFLIITLFVLIYKNNIENFYQSPPAITTQAFENNSTIQASENNSTTSAYETNYNTQVENNDQQNNSSNIPSVEDNTEGNDFIIRNKNTDKMLMTINNISDYILENDQVIVGKKFKMLKFLKEADMTVFRDDSDTSKDLTLGFNFKVYETQVPIIFEEF